MATLVNPSVLAYYSTVALVSNVGLLHDPVHLVTSLFGPSGWRALFVPPPDVTNVGVTGTPLYHLRDSSRWGLVASIYTLSVEGPTPANVTHLLGYLLAVAVFTPWMLWVAYHYGLPPRVQAMFNPSNGATLLALLYAFHILTNGYTPVWDGAVWIVAYAMLSGTIILTRRHAHVDQAPAEYGLVRYAHPPVSRNNPDDSLVRYAITFGVAYGVAEFAQYLPGKVGLSAYVCVAYFRFIPLICSMIAIRCNNAHRSKLYDVRTDVRSVGAILCIYMIAGKGGEFDESMEGAKFKGCIEHTEAYVLSHLRNGFTLCAMWATGALVSAYYYVRWMWTRAGDQSPALPQWVRFSMGCITGLLLTNFAMGWILHSVGSFDLCARFPVDSVYTVGDTLRAFVLAIVLLDVDVDADVKGWVQLVLFPLYLLGRVLFTVGWCRLHVADAFYKLGVTVFFGLWELFWVIARFVCNLEPVETLAPVSTRTRDLVAIYVKDAVSAVVSVIESFIASIPFEIRSAWAEVVGIVDSVYPDSELLCLTNGAAMEVVPFVAVAEPATRPRATRGRSPSRTRGRSASRKYRSTCDDTTDEAPPRPRVTRRGMGLPMGGQM